MLFVLSIIYLISLTNAANYDKCVPIDGLNLLQPIFSINDDDYQLRWHSLSKNSINKFHIINDKHLHLDNKILSTSNDQKFIIALTWLNKNRIVQTKKLCFVVTQEELSPLLRVKRQSTNNVQKNCKISEMDANASCNIANGPGTYYFENCWHAQFNLNSQTGVLSVKDAYSVDFETSPRLTVNIRYYKDDSQSNYETIIVNIEVTNKFDEPPRFLLDQYQQPAQISLSQGTSTKKSVVVFRAPASTAEQNTNLVFSLTYGNDEFVKNRFEVTTDSYSNSAIVSVKASSFESRVYQIIITVRDINSEFPANATDHFILYVHGESIPIQFGQRIYNFLFESSFEGSWNKTIGRITAYNSTNVIQKLSMTADTPDFLLSTSGDIYFKNAINKSHVQRDWFFFVSVSDVKTLVYVKVNVVDDKYQFLYNREVLTLARKTFCDCVPISSNNENNISKSANLNMVTNDADFTTYSNNKKIYICNRKKFQTNEIKEVTLTGDLKTPPSSCTVSVNLIAKSPKVQFCTGDTYQLSITNNVQINTVIFQAAICNDNRQFYFYTENAAPFLLDNGFITISGSLSSTKTKDILIYASTRSGAKIPPSNPLDSSNDAKMTLTILVNTVNNFAPVLTCTGSISINELTKMEINIITVTDNDPNPMTYSIIPNELMSTTMVSKFSMDGPKLKIENINATEVEWLRNYKRLYLTIESVEKGVPIFSTICHTKINLVMDPKNYPNLNFIIGDQTIIMKQSEATSRPVIIYAEYPFQFRDVPKINYQLSPTPNTIASINIVHDTWAEIIFKTNGTIQVTAEAGGKTATATVTVSFESNTNPIVFPAFSNNKVSVSQTNLSIGNINVDQFNSFVHPEYFSSVKVRKDTNSNTLKLFGNNFIGIMQYLIVQIRVYSPGSDSKNYQDRMIYVNLIEDETYFIADKNYLLKPGIQVPKNQNDQFIAPILIVKHDGSRDTSNIKRVTPNEIIPNGNLRVTTKSYNEDILISYLDSQFPVKIIADQDSMKLDLTQSEYKYPMVAILNTPTTIFKQKVNVVLDKTNNNNGFFYINPSDNTLQLLRSPSDITDPALLEKSYQLTINQFTEQGIKTYPLPITLNQLKLLPNDIMQLKSNSMVVVENTVNISNLETKNAINGVSYSLIDGADSSYFEIKNNILSNKNGLDADFPNGKQQYQLMIKASVPAMTAYLPFNVNITDINDNPPYLLPINLLRLVPAGIDNSEFKLNTSDPDTTKNPTFSVPICSSYLISGSETVKVAKALDYDSKKLTSISCPISVTEGSQTEKGELIIIPTSGLKNFKPEFSQTNFNIDVNNADTQGTVAVVMVKEPVDGVIYSPVQTNSNFQIVTNNNAAYIKLLQNLTEKSGSFQLKSNYNNANPSVTTINYNQITQKPIPLQIQNSACSAIDDSSTVANNKLCTISLTTSDISTQANLAFDEKYQLQDYLTLTIVNEQVNEKTYELRQILPLPRNKINPNSKEFKFPVSIVASTNTFLVYRINHQLELTYKTTNFQPTLSNSTFQVEENKKDVVSIGQTTISDPLFPNPTLSVKLGSSTYSNFFELRYSSGTTYNLFNKQSLDREAITTNPILLPMEIIFESKTSTSILSVSVIDVAEATTFSNGFTSVITHNIQWWNNSYNNMSINVGKMPLFTENNLDPDNPGIEFKQIKDVLTEGAFSISSTGEIQMKPNTPPGLYNLKANVVRGTVNAESSISINVYKINFDGLQNSVVLELSNLTCSEFQFKPPSNQDTTNNLSIADKIRRKVAEFLVRPDSKVLVKCITEILDSPIPMIRVIVAVSGSPFVKLSTLLRIMMENEKLIRDEMPQYKNISKFPLELCSGPLDYTMCNSGCMSVLNVNPWISASDMTSIVYQKECGCQTTNSDPMSCAITDACLNNGNCTNYASNKSFKCLCPPGFPGPRCQATSVAFLEPLSSVQASQLIGNCRNMDMSVNFITDKSSSSANILYIGPTTSFDVNKTQFISLSVSETNKFILHANWDKANIRKLELIANVTINDGNWHSIDFGLNEARKMYIMVDGCKSTPTTSDDVPLNTTGCYAELKVPYSSYINANTYPVLLGAFTPSNNVSIIPSTGLVGTIKNVRINGELMDIGITGDSYAVKVARMSPELENSCKNDAGGDLCGDNGDCWGKWNGAVKSGSCECKIGFIKSPSTGLCEDSSSWSSLISNADSVPYYSLENKVELQNNGENQLSFSFRTLESDGVLAYLIGNQIQYYVNETFKIHLEEGKLSVTKNLNGLSLQSMKISSDVLNNGAWHHVTVSRLLSGVEVKLNDGEFGNFYKSLPVSQSDSNFFHINNGGKLMVGIQKDFEIINGEVEKPNSLLSGACIKNLVVQNVPIQNDNVFKSSTTIKSCETDILVATQQSPNNLSASCSSEFIEKGQFGGSSLCQCPVGFSIDDQCMAQSACSDSNCKSTGRCYLQTESPGYRCECILGFAGTVCEISLAAIIAPIVIVILLLILIIIIIIIMKRRRIPKKSPEDLERETIIQYNESAGETDNKNYDLQKLQMALNNQYPEKGTVLNPFFVEQKEKADKDPGQYPLDYPLDYGYEGEGSIINDLSDIGTISNHDSEEESTYDLP